MNKEKPKKANRHLKNFFRGCQNRIALELICSSALIFAVTFITLGFIIVSRNSALFYHEFDYTDFCLNQQKCTLPRFSIPGGLPSPLFIQYKVNNFNQNHYRYVLTIPKNQLINQLSDNISNSNCVPYLTNAEMNKTVSVTGTLLNPGDVAIPCGVAAFSHFTDSFQITQIETNTSLSVSFKGIAWADDLQYKFRNIDLSRQWIDVTDERFINWMRISPYNSFVKTWGKINAGVPSGTLEVVVSNSWRTEAFRVRKSFILTNADFYGTPNTFLAVFFILFGFFSLGFWILMMFQLVGLYRRRKQSQAELVLNAIEAEVYTQE